MSAVDAVNFVTNLKGRKTPLENDLQDRFITACARKGIVTASSALTLFTELLAALPHCRSKAKAIGSAVQTYRIAYLKAHFPKAFFLAKDE
jgi:DNA polymerase III alpha subunit